MRILLVNKFYDPIIGGVESVVKQHAAFLREQGHEVTVLCCSGRFAVRTLVEERDGARVVRCASIGTFMSMPLAPVLFLHLLRLLLWSELVIYHLPFPLATVSALFEPVRRPVIVFWHSDVVQQKRLKPIVQFFQRALCRRARRAISVTRRRWYRYRYPLEEDASPRLTAGRQDCPNFLNVMRCFWAVCATTRGSTCCSRRYLICPKAVTLFQWCSSAMVR